jgi:xanthine dehydrogenase large subunit
MSAVGKNIPHDSARGHVSGTSIYIDDMPPLPGELVVDFFYSPVARGRIRALDLSEAAAQEGITGLFTWRDLPANRLGPIIQDEPLLAEEELSYIGQPIVVIAGRDRAAILRARAAIRIEIDEEVPVLSIRDAIAGNETIGDIDGYGRGDVEAALAAADHVLEGLFECGGQDHFYLESQAAVVIPGEDGTLTVHSSTQHPTEVQDVVAHLLGLKANEVICITKRMGGAFGGKESQATHPAVMAALVAQKTGRPARIVYTKDDDMIATGKRHPFMNRYRVGFDNDGAITALKVDLFSDGGAFADLSTAVMSRAMSHVDNAYFLPACEINGTVCRTNNPPNTAFRGFGGPQGLATIENIIEEIAAFLKTDAFDVRRRNCYGIGERNVTPYGQIVQNNTLPILFDDLCERADYRRRREDIIEFNRHSRTELRGLSMTAVKFGISFNTAFLNQASALVHIYRDGTVQVSTGATEMGQGVNTKIRQIVADELGIDPAVVRMMPTSTEKSNNASATAASSGSDLNGSAAADACRRIRRRLADCAAGHLAGLEHIEPSPADVVFENGLVYDSRRPDRRLSFPELVDIAYHSRISLGARGFHATPGLHFDKKKGKGSPFLYYTNGCAVSEVLIDRFTGQMKVLRSDLLMDIGKPINPGIDRGQITGGFIQGMGWLTTEELRYSEKGELWSHSPTTYKIPNIQDVPAIFNVDWIDNDSNEVNIRRSKAVGEPPLLLAVSVWTAAKNALSFVSGDEIPVLKAPATAEELLTRLTHYAHRRVPDTGDGVVSGAQPAPTAKH